MKLAITATGRDPSSNVDPRFGRARFFLVVDTATDEVAAHDNAPNLNAAQGAGIQAAETVARLGVEAVVTGNVGPKAFRALQAAGIRVYLAKAGTVTDAVRACQAGELKEASAASVESHW
jgi:predicted Fe-Mo cluster-binding NifX family protein